MLGLHGFLPPEINSGRMYAGAGAAPLLAAATASDGLAAELHSSAAGYHAVVAGLSSEGWLGPASMAMAAAATPYATWMSSTAAKVEEAAAQMRAAVVAYETAHAGVVHPGVVAANRANLATLIATNMLGQNTPAIAANWAEYFEYWVQDATVMDAYSVASTNASVLTEHTPAPSITDPGGDLARDAAARQTNANDVGTQVQHTLGQVVSQILPGSGSGSAAASEGNTLGSMLGLMSVKDALGWATLAPQNGSYLFSLANSLQSLGKAFTSVAPAAAAAAGASSLAPALGAGATGFGGLGSLASSVSAGVGQSGTIGALSVPQAWAAAAPAASPMASLVRGVRPVSGTNPAGILNGVPMLANAARAAAGSGSGQFGAMPRFDLRPSVIPMSPAAG